jgi:hypothetical protein
VTQQARGPRVHERWAHLRFSVIGQLLAAPPSKGELRAAIEALAARQWRHPTTGEPVRFGFSTIERWYYRALKERSDPVGVLRRRLRTDAGQQPAMSDAVRQVVLAQYAAHKTWSVQLHHDNLVATAETRADLRPLPCYDTLRRFMKANGLDQRRRVTSLQTAVNGPRNLPSFGRAKFPTLAGLVINRWRDRRLHSWVAGRGAWVAASAVEVGSEPLIGCAQARGRRAGEDGSSNPRSE